MSVVDTVKERIFRSVEDEFSLLDDGLDAIRVTRNTALTKLSAALEGVTLSELKDPETNSLQLVTTLFKGLSDAEKSLVQAANTKLRLREQESNSQAAEIIVAALRDGTTIGEITDDMKPGQIDDELQKRFEGKITEGIMREDNRHYGDVTTDV